eukprot:4350302-Amphidinium_carterae.1
MAGEHDLAINMYKKREVIHSGTMREWTLASCLLHELKWDDSPREQQLCSALRVLRRALTTYRASLTFYIEQQPTTALLRSFDVDSFGIGPGVRADAAFGIKAQERASQ